MDQSRLVPSRVINQLLSRFLRFDDYLYKQNIEWDLLQRGDLLYDRFFRQHSLSGDFLRKAEVIPMLIRGGLLEESYEVTITKLQNQIKSLQSKLFLEYNNLVAREKHKKSIAEVKKKLISIVNTAHSLDYVTLEGYCEWVKERFVFRNSLYLRSKKRARGISEREFDQAFRALYEFNSTLDLRNLAKSQDWRFLWSAKKEGVFQFQPLSPNQLSLINLSKFYDSVDSSSEKPSDLIIQDNDALDGWYNEMLKKQGSEKTVRKTTGKQNEFIFVDNQEDANKVYMSNSKELQNVKR